MSGRRFLHLETKELKQTKPKAARVEEVEETPQTTVKIQKKTLKQFKNKFSWMLLKECREKSYTLPDEQFLDELDHWANGEHPGYFEEDDISTQQEIIEDEDDI